MVVVVVVVVVVDDDIDCAVAVRTYRTMVRTTAVKKALLRLCFQFLVILAQSINALRVVLIVVMMRVLSDTKRYVVCVFPVVQRERERQLAMEHECLQLIRTARSGTGPPTAPPRCGPSGRPGRC